MTKAENNHDRLFPNGKHVTSLISDKTYFIIGKGVKSTKTLSVKRGSDGRFILKIKEYANGGDKMVPIWSANIGGSTPYAKTYYANGVDHTSLVKSSNTIDMVKYIICGAPDCLPKNITHESNY